MNIEENEEIRKGRLKEEDNGSIIVDAMSDFSDRVENAVIPSIEMVEFITAEPSKEVPFRIEIEESIANQPNMTNEQENYSSIDGGFQASSDQEIHISNIQKIQPPNLQENDFKINKEVDNQLEVETLLHQASDISLHDFLHLEDEKLKLLDQEEYELEVPVLSSQVIMKEIFEQQRTPDNGSLDFHDLSRQSTINLEDKERKESIKETITEDVVNEQAIAVPPVFVAFSLPEENFSKIMTGEEGSVPVYLMHSRDPDSAPSRPKTARFERPKTAMKKEPSYISPAKTDVSMKTIGSYVSEEKIVHKTTPESSNLEVNLETQGSQSSIAKGCSLKNPKQIEKIYSYRQKSNRTAIPITKTVFNGEDLPECENKSHLLGFNQVHYKNIEQLRNRIHAQQFPPLPQSNPQNPKHRTTNAPITYFHPGQEKKQTSREMDKCKIEEIIINRIKANQEKSALTQSQIDLFQKATKPTPPPTDYALAGRRVLNATEKFNAKYFQNHFGTAIKSQNDALQLLQTQFAAQIDSPNKKTRSRESPHFLSSTENALNTRSLHAFRNFKSKTEKMSFISPDLRTNAGVLAIMPQTAHLVERAKTKDWKKEFIMISQHR